MVPFFWSLQIELVAKIIVAAQVLTQNIIWFCFIVILLFKSGTLPNKSVDLFDITDCSIFMMKSVYKRDQWTSEDRCSIGSMYVTESKCGQDHKRTYVCPMLIEGWLLAKNTTILWAIFKAMIFLQLKLNRILWDKRLARIGLILLHAFVYEYI